MAQGPNVKKLIIHKMTIQMVPPGTGTIAQAVASFAKVGDHARQATEWVEAAIRAVKQAPDNPYGDDDEAIAGVILRGIEERKAKARSA